jgi:hypothetical protein
VKNNRLATRKRCSAEQMNMIVAEALRGEDCFAEPRTRQGIVMSLSHTSTKVRPEIGKAKG